MITNKRTPKRKRAASSIKVSSIAAIMAFIMLLNTAILFGENSTGTNKLYLSVEKPSYELGEEIILIISADNAKDYDLKITSMSNLYRYSGELKNNIVFIVKENGMHRVDLIEKFTGRLEDSLEFNVGKEPYDLNMANDTAKNNTLLPSTSNSPNTTNISTTDTANTQDDPIIRTDKRTYSEGETVLASVAVPAESGQEYRLYYEYEGFSQRYMGDFSFINFIPKGIGIHSLILKDRNEMVLEKQDLIVTENKGKTDQKPAEAEGKDSVLQSKDSISEHLADEAKLNRIIKIKNRAAETEGIVKIIRKSIVQQPVENILQDQQIILRNEDTALSPNNNPNNESNATDITATIIYNESNNTNTTEIITNNEDSISNNESENTNSTETNITVTATDQDKNISEGNLSEGNSTILNISNSTAINDTSNSGNAEDNSAIFEYDLVISFDDSPLQSLSLNNLIIPESDQELNLEINNVPLDNIHIDTEQEIKLLKAWSIDPSNLNFTNGTATAVAKGQELWKCRNWSNQNQTCLGSWEKIMSIVPGQEYAVMISPDDPGFAETGVATVNTRKPIYYPAERAEIVMVVLNTQGYLVGDANVTLEVTLPDATAMVLSTADGSVTSHEKGIYDATFSNTLQPGIYYLKVRAEGDSINYTMQSYFLVMNEYDFDIIREIPATTDPWKGPFVSKIRVISHNQENDFNFTEVLPAEINVTDFGDGVMEISGEKRMITWTITNNTEVSYTAEVPKITPNLYEIGKSYVSYGTSTFEEARPWYLAVDPVFSGQFFMLWDGTAGSIPSPWTCMSCNPGDPFRERMIRGESSYGTTGGNSVHSHTIRYINHTAGLTVDEDNNDGIGGAQRASGAHTHNSIVQAPTNNQSNYPPFRTMLVISYPGIPEAIPPGAIGIFNTTTLPAGWNRYSPEDNYIIVGNGTTNQTGGALNHTHTVSVYTSASAGQAQSRTGGVRVDVGGDAHTHLITGNTAPANNTPPYINVIFARANITTRIPYGQGFIGMFNNTLGDGWVNMSQVGQPFYRRVIRGSSAYGATGGNETHYHSNTTLVTNTSGLATTRRDSGRSFARNTHTHNFGLSFTENNSMAPYINVVFGYASIGQPIITTYGCFRQGTGWINCTLLAFNSNLTAVRSNCSSTNNRTINNMSFALRNIEDNKVYFNATVTNYVGGYWTYNLSQVLFQDSGNFTIDLTCNENVTGMSSELDVNWSIPWGKFSIRTITPNAIANVTQNRFFNFSVQVNCTGGECGSANVTLDPVNWWNTSWRYQLPINISEVSGSNLYNYQFNITIDTRALINTSKMNGNCSDIRFANNASAPLSYWIENGCNTTSTHIWVKGNVSSRRNTSIFMYYGNPSAVSMSNASEAMFIYENMSTAPSGTLSGTATYINWTNGVRLTQAAGSQSGFLTYNKNPGAGFYAKFQYWIGGGSGADAVWLAVHDTTITGTQEDLVMGGYHFVFDEYNQSIKFTKSTVSNGAPISFSSQAGQTDSTWHTAEFYYYNNGTFANGIIYRDSVLRVNGSDTTPQPTSGNIVAFGARTGGSTNEHRVRNVSIREWVRQEPIITLNNEVMLKGDIPMDSGTPFYTIDPNPRTPINYSCLDAMISSRSCNITWAVNATGAINSTWEFYTIAQSLNYSGITNTSSSSFITIIGNLPPSAINATILPDRPLYNENLNCTFIITDSNNGDTLAANITWYLNNVSMLSEIVPAQSGVATKAYLGEGNTTVDDSWHCGVTPYDYAAWGSEINSSAVTILATRPPVVANIECQRNRALWLGCSNIAYNQNLTGVRARCIDTDGYTVNATFVLTNLEHNSFYFTGNTTDNSTGYFTYDNPDLTITESGTYNLSVTCLNVNNTPGYGYSNWTVPWGKLVVGLVNPSRDINVTRNKYFSFTAQVNCTIGECAWVNATLDPTNWWNSSWYYRRTITAVERANKNLSNYQFNISFDTRTPIAAGKMNGNCSDIRFVNSANALLDYWIEQGCNNTNTTIWVRNNVSALQNTTFYMYYGNPNATNFSNPFATMFIYEDMKQAPSGSLTGNASYIDENWGVSLTVASNNLLGYLYYIRNPGPGFYGYYETWAGGGDGADATWIGVHENSASSVREDIVDGGYHFTVDEYGTNGANGRVAFTNSTVDNGPSIAQWGNTTLDDSRWHTLEVYFYNNGTSANAVMYHDGVYRVNGTHRPSQSINGNYFLFAGRTGGDNNNHYIRTIKVRKYVRPEPNITIDEELTKNKGDIPMYNGTPFYTITANPMTSANTSCLANMRLGQSCNTTWVVNATGSTGIPWEFFVTYQSSNFSQYVITNITKSINITIIGNLMPYMGSVTITPADPLPVENLNCTFTVLDTNANDVLSANVTWYRNKTYYSRSTINVTNGVASVAYLGFGNTTLGEDWMCGVAPYDETLWGLEVNSTNVTIVFSKPPVIRQIQCLINNSVWTNCTRLSFGSNLSGVRANCTTAYMPISNVTFNMSNIPDSTLFFQNTSYANISGWWTVSTNVTINDSGEFVVNAVCMNNESASDTEYVNWTVPWGSIVINLIDPYQNGYVEYNKFFTFTSEIRCVGGECGSIVALLDPEKIEKSQDMFNSIEHGSKTISIGPISAITTRSDHNGLMQSLDNPIHHSLKPAIETASNQDSAGYLGKGKGNDQYPNGLVTVNTKKAAYGLGEDPEIYIVVLDKEGYPAASDRLKLTITRPDCKKEVFDTEDFSIVKEGIYYMKYGRAGLAGKYQLTLESRGVIADSLISSFEINENEGIEIKRDTPLAINPWDGSNGEFKTSITITKKKASCNADYCSAKLSSPESLKATDDLKGANEAIRYGITEYLPKNIEIIESNGALVWRTEKETLLTWHNKSLDDTVSYIAKPEKKTPDRIMLKASVSEKGRIIEEARPWFIAVDPIYHYSASGSNITYYVSAGTYTQTSGGTYANTAVADCKSGTCTQANSFETGFADFNGAGRTCYLNTTLTFNLSNIKPLYLKNLSLTWGGCWHGDTNLNNPRCDNVTRPSFLSGTGGGTFDLWVYTNGSWQQLECVNTVNNECGGFNEINLGTVNANPSWGSAYGYNTFRFQDTSINSSFMNNTNKLMSVRWRTWGAGVCSNGAGGDIILALDYANLSVGWDYLIKNGTPISTVIGDEPFYTNDSNPFDKRNFSCLGNMVHGNACNITWNVNATGGINTTHGFWVIANSSTYNLSVKENESKHITLTIRDITDIPPVVTLNSPPANNWTNSTTIVFNCSATSLSGLTNITLYGDFLGAFQENGTNLLGGKSNSTTFTRYLTEGRYTWNCKAMDINSNEAFSSSNRTLTVDYTAPAIFLSKPIDGESISNTTVLINFTVIDNLDSSLTCNITRDSVVVDPNFAASNGTPTLRPILGNNESTHFWNVTCWDDARNTNYSETRNYTISNLPPTVTLLTVNAYATNAYSFDLFYLPNDSSELAIADLYINGTWSMTNDSLINGGINWFTISGIDEGTYNWTVNVTDAGDLTTQATPRTFIVDRTPPRISLAFPPDPYNSNSSTVTFSYYVYDNIALNMLCKITVNGSDMLTGIPSPNNSALPISRNVTGIRNGINYWNITCQDNATNTNTSETRMLNVSAPPTVTLNTPADNHSRKTTTITLNYTPWSSLNLTNCSLIINNALNQSNTSAIRNGQLNNFTLTNLISGYYNWSVNCTDTTNFVGSSVTRTFIVDLIAPTITLNSPAPNETVYGNSVLLNYTAYDNIATMLYCNLTFDNARNRTNVPSPNGQWVNISVNVNESIHFWNITCGDIAGNNNWSETRNFSAIGAPTVSLVFPPPNAILNYSQNVNFTYIPSSSNLLNISRLVINGNVNQTFPAPSNGVENYFWVNFTDGIYFWMVNITDNMKLNGSSEQRTLTIDSTSPIVTMRNPNGSGNITTNNVSFIFNLTDNLAGTMLCNISVAGVLEWINVNVSNRSTVTRYKTMFDGDYNWSVSCLDNANNTNAYQLINFTVKAPPTVTLNFPTPDYRTKNNSIHFNYTPWDSIGFENCSLYINDTFNNVSSGFTRNIPNYFDVYNLPEGRYNWTIECVDQNPDFNIYRAPNQNFTVDATGPDIALNYPGPGEIINSNTVQFNWTATDYPGISLNCSLYIDGAYNRSLSQVSGTHFTPTISNFTQGNHNWSVNCSDDLNNSAATATRDFTINNPDLYVDDSRIGFNNSNPDENQSINITVNVSNIGGVPANNVIVGFWDGLPWAGGAYLGNDTGSVVQNGSKTFSLSWNITNGYHTIFISADPSNLIAELIETNNNASRNISVLSVYISSPASPSNSSIPNITVTFNARDYTGGLINYTVYVDNVSTGQTGQLIDNNPAILNVTVPQGTHSIKIGATDLLGRRKNSTAIIVTVDSIAPTPIIHTPNNTWFNYTTPLINISATDSLDANINYTLYSNGTPDTTGNLTNRTSMLSALGVQDNGIHIITLGVIDDFNNTANSTPITIYVDTMNPAIILDTPTDEANLTNRTVTFNYSVSDNLASYIMCNISLDGQQIGPHNITNGQSRTYTANNLAEGTHSWNVTCRDQAANTLTSSTWEFNIYIAPNITLVAPPNNSWSNNGTNTFYFNVSDDTGIENCSLLVNGTVLDVKTNAFITNNATNNLTAAGLASGIYNWSVQCIDNTTFKTNATSSTWTLRIDLIAPEPIIETLNYTWFNNSAPVIRFNISDNMDSPINYTFLVDGFPNANGSVNNYSSSTASLIALANGQHTIILQGTDDAENIKNSSEIIIFVDTIRPLIDIHAPANGEQFNATTVDFNFTAYDDLADYLMCNLTISNGMNSTNINATNNSMQNITKTGFVSGTYFWNISCVDFANNRNTSSTRNFTIKSPDIIITSQNITFNETTPEEGKNVTVFANIYNIGGIPANNITVQFWKGNPLAGGSQINGNLNITLLNNGENITVSLTYQPTIGENNVFVVIDPPAGTNGSLVEENESNNIANNSLATSLYQVYAGNLSGFIELEKQSINRSLYNWNVSNITGSNLYITDLEANPNFLRLQAIGRNASNQSVNGDFEYIDARLGSTNFTDSINRTFTIGGAPIETATITIFSKEVNNVPTINSTNYEAFKTGILWDMSDGGSRYNGTQDIVFISQTNQGQAGSRGTYDFEIKVPALLRNYNLAGSSLGFYAELK